MYRSATAVVIHFFDAGAPKGYLVVFQEAAAKFEVIKSGCLSPEQLEYAAAKLGVSASIFDFEGDITEKEFVKQCKEVLGEERSVVIKFMQDEQQWRRERDAREGFELESRFVVQALPAPPDDDFQRAIENLEGGLHKFVEKHLPPGITLGKRALVMDKADRNLLQIFQQERPGTDAVRSMARQVILAVQHLHQRGLAHGDIKALNVSPNPRARAPSLTPLPRAGGAIRARPAAPPHRSRRGDAHLRRLRRRQVLVGGPSARDDL